MKQRIVFACSGSAGNSAAIPRLAATCDAEIVAMTLDVGQGRELEAVRQAALAAGAIRAHVLDVREEFARDCILGSLQGGGEEEEYPLGHALARPLIARKLIEIARIEGATTIAHGGDAGDHEAIEAAAAAIDPSMRVVAASGATAAARGYAVRTTLWGRSFERRQQGGDELPEEIYSLTAPSKRAPDGPAHVEISFEAGLPVAVNGVPMTLPELIESVTTIAGNHGVGRVTDEASGTAGEAPAAVVLRAAHAALGVAAMRAADATVRVELFRGRHRVVSAHHS